MKITPRTEITKLTMRAAIALVVASVGATWCLLAMNPAGALTKPTKKRSATEAPLMIPVADIVSAGPLTHVLLGNDLSCQVQHIDDAPDYEFYGPDIFPADAGTFIALDGVLYAPDFINHDYSSAGFFLGDYTPFTPLSQTPVSGSGTTADPFKVITVVDVAATGLLIQQTDTYVVGQEHYTTEVMISNTGAGTASGVLYRAADAFLGGSDTGYGFTEVFSGNRNAVACSVNPDNMPPGKIEQWIPLTGGNNYFQNEYDTVWSAIGSQAPFPDTCACTDFLDNGGGLSWNFSIPAGGSATYSHVTTFSPLGLEGLVTSKTADSPTSPAGTQNGYTITIQNPNANDVTVSSITDTLPAGFAYVPGSTTDATTNDPAIFAQMLTWSGSLSVPARDSISLHFAVIVADTPGDYFNEAGGSAEESYNVIATGPTAKITVTAAATPTPTAGSELYAYCYRHSDIYAYSYRYGDCNSYLYSNSYRNSHLHADANARGHVQHRQRRLRLLRRLQLPLRQPQQLPILRLLRPQPRSPQPQHRRRVQRPQRRQRLLQLQPQRRQPQPQLRPRSRLRQSQRLHSLPRLQPPLRSRQPQHRCTARPLQLRRPQPQPILQLLPPLLRSRRRQRQRLLQLQRQHLLLLQRQHHSRARHRHRVRLYTWSARPAAPLHGPVVRSPTATIRAWAATRKPGSTLREMSR